MNASVAPRKAIVPARRRRLDHNDRGVAIWIVGPAPTRERRQLRRRRAADDRFWRKRKRASQRSPVRRRLETCCYSSGPVRKRRSTSAPHPSSHAITNGGIAHTGRTMATKTPSSERTIISALTAVVLIG